MKITRRLRPGLGAGRIETLTRRLRHSLLLPSWLIFRFRNRHYRFAGRYAGVADGMTSKEVDRYLGIHERNLRELLTARPGLRFLEIGIGPEPNIERLGLLQAAGVKYTGVDFASVCESHALKIQRAGLSSDAVEWVRNTTGTYAWNLFEMLGEDRHFDVVYLDGHHTFYVDIPAVFLGDRLLEAGGLFLVDDIRWSLGAFQVSLLRYFSVWRFYRTMYDFSAYTPEQRSLPHVGLMAQRVLVDALGYGIDRAHSSPYWWALRKPPHDLPFDVPAEWAVSE
jgi:SAM-dependent methyltransferase